MLSRDSTSKQYAKNILDQAIDHSVYTPPNARVKNRNLEVRWELAAMINLPEIQQRCQQGYGTLTKELLVIIARLVLNDFGQSN